MKTNLLALTVTLALNATREEVLEAIDGICDTFNIDLNGSVSPAALVDVTNIDGPATASTAPAAATAGLDVDANGLPWDERIHSSNRQKNADGSWRSKRNVDAALKTKVEKELRATLSSTPSPAATTPPAPPAAAAAPTPPAPPAPPVAAAPPAPPANPAYTNFVAFIADCTAKNLVDPDWVKASLANFGVANGDMQNLAHRPDLIPAIEGAIRTALGL